MENFMLHPRTFALSLFLGLVLVAPAWAGFPFQYVQLTDGSPMYLTHTSFLHFRDLSRVDPASPARPSVTSRGERLAPR